MRLLPNIAIKGVGKNEIEIKQSLIEVETILVMLGYDVPDEEWNNEVFSYDFPINHLHCNLNSLVYHTHNVNNYVTFKSTQIKKLINYVEKFKNKR